jgi:hypothetical protein
VLIHFAFCNRRTRASDSCNLLVAALQWHHILDSDSDRLADRADVVALASKLCVHLHSNSSIHTKIVNLLHTSVADLSGPIPSQIGRLSKLTELLLDHDQIQGAHTGTIPYQIFQLPQLRSFTSFGQHCSGPTYQFSSPFLSSCTLRLSTTDYADNCVTCVDARCVCAPRPAGCPPAVPVATPPITPWPTPRPTPCNGLTTL